MVTVGVGRTEGHMCTASVFQRYHIRQSFLSVLNVFCARKQALNFWHFKCDECSKCMKQAGMFMSVGVQSLTNKCQTSHKSAVLTTKLYQSCLNGITFTSMLSLKFIMFRSAWDQISLKWRISVKWEWITLNTFSTRENDPNYENQSRVRVKSSIFYCHSSWTVYIGKNCYFRTMVQDIIQ